VDGTPAKGFLKVLTSRADVTEKVLGKEAVRELKELEKESSSILTGNSYKDLDEKDKAELKSHLEPDNEADVKKDQ
jgi:hypothetical protein